MTLSYITPNGQQSTDWQSLVKGKAINTSFFYDYLRYQTPLTLQTPIEEVCLQDQKLNALLASNAVAISPSTYRICLEAEIKKIKGVKAAFHLSGGLDSSLLVLLAKEFLNQSDFITASCKTLGSGASCELELAEQVADIAGVELKIFDFTDIDIFLCGEYFIEYGPGYPIGHPSHLTRLLIDTELSKSVYKTVVTGRGPDEVLGGYAWHAPEFSSFNTHYPRIEATDAQTLEDLFIHCPHSEAFKSYQEHFKAGYSLDNRMAYDLKTIYMHWNVIDKAYGESLGLKYVSPFLNPEIMKGCLGLPESLRIFESHRGKSFMVETFKDLYPSFLLDAPKRGLSFDMGAYFRRYDTKTIMAHLFHNSDYNKRAFNKKALETMIERTLTGKKNYGWQLWGVYLIALTAANIENFN